MDMADPVEEAKESIHCLANEWNALKLTLAKEKLMKKGSVSVSEYEFRKLQQEMSSAKEMINKLQPAVSNCLKESKDLREELEQSSSSLDSLQQTRQHLQSRYDAVKTECDQERTVKLKMQAELSEVSNQLSLQSEYCASMGAVCCTLLWKASQQEQMVPHLLAGSQMKSFLPVVSHTLESFLATYEEDPPEEMNEEIQFVLALVGTITNVAASAVGREFLAKSNHCRMLVDTFNELLSKPPSKHLIRLKGLAVMGLYNLSINQNGVKVLNETKGLVPLLTWLLSAESSEEMKLHTLLLLHSLVSDTKNMNLLMEAKEGITDQLLKDFSTHKDKEIRDIFLEINQAIQVVNVEQ